MGKVFKALSKSESEQPQHSLAAVVVAEEEERDALNNHKPAEDSRLRALRPGIEAARTDQENGEAFDFLRFSLNAPATEAFDREATAAAAPPSPAASPVR